MRLSFCRGNVLIIFRKTPDCGTCSINFALMISEIQNAVFLRKPQNSFDGYSEDVSKFYAVVRLRSFRQRSLGDGPLIPKRVW
jgi:hypothetical protein